MRVHSCLVSASALIVVAAAVVACGGDDRTPTATPRVSGPNLTASSGQTTVTLGRSAIDPFHIQADFENSKVEIKVKDPSDINVNSSTVAAGGTTGWHKHSGPVLVVVTSGVFTMYHADDPSCTAHTYPAGTAFYEVPEDVHIGRNEGTVPLTWVATAILPRGVAARIDMPVPGNCAF
jgi:quercetin dioxygenase-like cupin family protein